MTIPKRTEEVLEENNKKVIVKVLASDPMDAIKQVQRKLS